MYLLRDWAGKLGSREQLAVHTDKPSSAAAVMRSVPLGAAVLAGTAVALLVAGYLLVYLLVFIPRGTVG